MKHTTLNPDSNAEIIRDKKPANPNATAMSDWMQNPLFAVHVATLLSCLAISVPAESADSNKYAKTWSWLKSNQTWQNSGKMVEPREISQAEASISNNEYTATIAFAATTNRKAPKSYHRGESDLAAIMNTAAESAKQKAARRTTKMR